MKQLNRRTLEQILALSSEGIAVANAADPEFPVVYHNPAYAELTGYESEEILGRPWRLLSDGSHDEAVLREIREAMGRSESWEMVLPDIRKDGTSWVSRVAVQPLYNARGNLEFYLCSQATLSNEDAPSSGLEVGLLERELNRARQRIAGLDRIDPATGVFRYEYFLELARRDFGIAKRDSRTVSIIVVEVNDLEVYRQTFGDKAADSCLRMVAAQMTGSLRRSGDLCASGGEATLVALVNGQDPDEARAVANRIADNVRGLGLHNPRAHSGRYITVGIGVAGGTNVTEDPEVLIARAREEIHGGAPSSLGESGALG